MSEGQTRNRRSGGLARTVLFALLGVAAMTAAAGAILIGVQGTRTTTDTTTKNTQQLDTASGANPSGSSAPSPAQEKADPNARSPGKSEP